jgi:hypothetical protein
MTFSASARPSERWWSLLSSVPVITLGLLLVTLAMLKAPWPPDPESVIGTTVSYAARLQGKHADLPLATNSAAYQTSAWYGRRLLDGLALGLVIVGYFSVTLMIMLDEWRALVLLMLIGVVGTLYGGSVGLYIGPIVTTGGFALVLFGAGLNLISHYRVEATEQES